MPSQPHQLSTAIAELGRRMPALKAVLDGQATPQDAEQLATLVEALGGRELGRYLRQVDHVPVQVVVGQILTRGELVRELQALRDTWTQLNSIFAVFGK